MIIKTELSSKQVKRIKGPEFLDLRRVDMGSVSGEGAGAQRYLLSILHGRDTIYIVGGDVDELKGIINQHARPAAFGKRLH